jgi:hypothetical protein
MLIHSLAYRFSLFPFFTFLPRIALKQEQNASAYKRTYKDTVESTLIWLKQLPQEAGCRAHDPFSILEAVLHVGLKHRAADTPILHMGLLHTFKASLQPMFFILPISVSTVYWRILHFPSPHFGPPGQNFLHYNFSFGLVVPSISSTKFSLLPHLEVG